jgi:DNA-binding LacI/PurR family transcriptional regulator
MAIGAMSAFLKSAYPMLRDVRIVGANEITLASCSGPSLTNVSQPKQDAGSSVIQIVTECPMGRFGGGTRVLHTECASDDMPLRSYNLSRKVRAF